jgi:hypothetical protein
MARGSSNLPLTPADQLRELLLDVLRVSQQRYEEDQVRLAQTVGGVMLRGANAVPVGLGGALGTGTLRPITSAATLMGWHLKESTGGAPATVNLHDGGDAGAPQILQVGVAAGATDSQWFGPGGVSLSEGLFLEIVTGALVGAVFLRGSD